MIRRGEIFLDSSFAIALSSPADENHASARQIAIDRFQSGARWVTTRAVLVEIGDALSRRRFREAAIALITSFEGDPHIDVVHESEELFRKAFTLYRERRDKEWGLTDCLSFVVMWERGIADALTADHHFRQAGFRPLLDSSRG